MSRFLRDYVPGDLDSIEPIDAVGDYVHSRRNAQYWIERMGPRFVRTIVDYKGTPLAVGNMTVVNVGVLELHSYVDKRVESCALLYGRAMRELVDFVWMSHPGVHRLQISVRADQPWASRWATFLKFDFEGRLRSYGANQEDHFLYAKVRE